MEAAWSSETSLSRRHDPEDLDVNLHRHENLRSLRGITEEVKEPG
jgi:hypothetical protein